jgi:large subunit ribosomal protein L25
MEEVRLSASIRTRFGKKVAHLRREDKIPAILYGKSVDKPIPVTLDLGKATKLLKEASSSTLITVDVDGKEHTTLVRDYQIDFVRGTLQHVDFLVVSLTETVRASVSIVVEGVAPIIEEEGGLLVTGLEQLEVEALPQNLPERLTLDVSGLTSFGSTILVRDLVVPADVTVLSDPEELLVVATAPSLEEIVDEVEDDELLEGEEGEEGEEGAEGEAEEAASNGSDGSSDGQ